MISVEPAEPEDAARLRNPDPHSLTHKDMDVILWELAALIGNEKRVHELGPIASGSGH